MGQEQTAHGTRIKFSGIGKSFVSLCVLHKQPTPFVGQEAPLTHETRNTNTDAGKSSGVSTA
ncbi:hypothetical protein E2C01_051846 [Portunus trituberculatus]|uniref:Uncharacterized protein n=1 Tax=Portunus trituberculatus TaxID=210409 RepID=A0A5B7GKT0_PORTR|nr:hypothetical protein [Portunus trituberculatus]